MSNKNLSYYDQYQETDYLDSSNSWNLSSEYVFFKLQDNEMIKKVTNFPSNYTLKKVLDHLIQQKDFQFEKKSSFDFEIYLSDKQGNKLENFPELELNQKLEHIKFRRFFIEPKHSKKQVQFPTQISKKKIKKYSCLCFKSKQLVKKSLIIFIFQQWFFRQDQFQQQEDLVIQKAMKKGVQLYRKHLISKNLHRGLSNFPGGFMNQMTDYEAKLILGLEECGQLDKQIINKAFVQQISINHPDRQGSQYISSKIIEAKDLLLKINQ